MSLIKLLKKSVPRLPYAIGNMLSKLPYEQRPFLSKVYRKRKEEIQAYSLMGPQQKRGFVFERVQDSFSMLTAMSSSIESTTMKKAFIQMHLMDLTTSNRFLLSVKKTSAQSSLNAEPPAIGKAVVFL